MSLIRGEKLSRPVILVTNDDGVQSSGLKALVAAVNDLGDVRVVAPEEPRSGTSMSLTFHKPLRISKTLVGAMQYYAVSGSPADAVMIAVHKLAPRKPDLVISGINFGDNTTFQDVFASGTVAAAIEGAIMGIPAIAFSMGVPDESIFSPSGFDLDFHSAAAIAAQIAAWVIQNGLPPSSHLLNVNFPRIINRSTKIFITKLAARKFRDYVIERRDPRKRPYYWIWGKRLSDFDKDTDAYVVHVLKGISITPLNLNLSSQSAPQLNSLKEHLES